MPTGPSWKWMVAILIGLAFAGFGYDYREMHRHIEENAIAATTNQVDIVKERVRNDIQFTSIDRRLDRMESALERIETTLNAVSVRHFNMK